MKYIIVGNWKMNPGSLEEAKKTASAVRRVAAELKQTDAVICPPFPYIVSCVPKEPVRHYHIGAQSVSVQETVGAYTGEVSAGMLSDIGAKYVIVGHSEERKRGDSDAVVAKRLKAVLGAGMTAIVCVGELTRDADGSHLEALKDQIRNSLADIPSSRAKDIILAYEPVWAIGAKEPMRSEDIYEMSIFVKKVFADVFTPEAGVRAAVLYGGSVNSHNARDIMVTGQVDGLLVGRDSVIAANFVELLKEVDGI